LVAIIILKKINNKQIMLNKYCSNCGTPSSTEEAIYCFSCGTKFLSINSFERRHLAVFEMPELLTAAGSFIALLGSLIGIAISVYFMDIYGFTPVIATFFIVNFFAFFAFVFSGLGLILAFKKRLRHTTKNLKY
jgi:hypothetical protein